MAQLMARQSKAFQVLHKGQEIEGTVKKLTSQEILLDIGAKSDALVLEVEKSNMDSLLAILKVGDSVRAVVISPEAEDGFPVVSLRRQLDNMIFSKLDSQYKSGMVFNVRVGDGTRGGYFVETEDGIKGFLPASQVIDEQSLSGKTIPVKIIESDRVKKRVIFSQKATLYTTDLDEIKKLAAPGATFEGTVTGVTSYGLYVTIEPKKGSILEGFVHISEISYERVENLGALYKKGDKIQVSVIDVDVENRRVNMSVKRLTKDAFEKAASGYKKEQKVKGTVTKVSSRGVTLEIAKDVNALIQASKIPAGVEYKAGQVVDLEISDVDNKRRIVNASPIVTKTFVGYR